MAYYPTMRIYAKGLLVHVLTSVILERIANGRSQEITSVEWVPCRLFAGNVAVQPLLLPVKFNLLLARMLWFLKLVN